MKKHLVGSDGFVAYVDHMGSDQDIVQAARVSYGQDQRVEELIAKKEDRGLIRYLMRHRHTTPFEMCELKFLVRVPMDVWRQWVRHRTACLSGDTMLHFDLPGGIERRGNQLYKLSVREIFERFQPTENITRPDKQRNPDFKKERVIGMQLRCVNESTMLPSHTGIVDIWESGVKEVYEVSLGDRIKVKMSKDHLCLTDKGWLPLRMIVELPERKDSGWTFLDEVVKIASITSLGNTGMVASFNQINPDTEHWSPIPGWDDYYEISTQGRVRRTIGGKGSRSVGRCKKITAAKRKNYLMAVTSLNKPGWQETVAIAPTMLKVFVGPKPGKGYEACHIDGNSLNNDLENLCWATPQENSDDRVRDAATTQLNCHFKHITNVRYVGEEMTYDIEVAGPHHNFSAEGMIVHNSINEYSTRYKPAIDSMATTEPDEWRLQSSNNKQGSSGEFVTEWTAEHPRPSVYLDSKDNDSLDHWLKGLTPGVWLSTREKALQELAEEVYQERLRLGVAREQARKDLPLSNYTEAYWKIDLHNLLHFLSLRLDSHAQKEIRDFATPMFEIVKELFPLTAEAFEDYRLGGMVLSRLEIGLIKLVLQDTAEYGQPTIEEVLEKHVELLPEEWYPHYEGGKLKTHRERDEAFAKLKKLGLL